MRSGLLLSGLAVFVVFCLTSVSVSRGTSPLDANAPSTHSAVSTTTTTVPSTTAAPSTTQPPSTGETIGAQSGVQSASEIPATTTTTIPLSTSSPDSVGAQGTALTLGGEPHNFIGVNAYEIATQWGTNAGCGGMETDAQLEQLFASLPPDSLIRFWAYQGTMATDFTTHQINWAPLDRIFSLATQYHQKLIVSLTGQSGTCDNMHWQDPSWYSSGFMQVFDDPASTDGRGLTPLSYWAYIQQVVARYRNSPALAMWEPVSEPEASTCPVQYEPTNCGGHQTCPDETAAAQALRHFFDVVGGEIHQLDPEHLVESGTIGSGQCGTSGSDYQYVSASPGIDVLSYHDYYGAAAVGGDQWNGIGVRIATAKALNKPIIDGELGIQAGSAPGCTGLATRAQTVAAKMTAQFAAGVSALLEWNWAPTPDSSCTYGTFPGDPLMQVLGAGAPQP